MMPRLFDYRVGYFTASTIDYGRDVHRAQRVRYINRWRLEKKDPNAELSEPIKPIVYYIDPATPAKWAPWLKRGVEDWQKAFEAAGFKNAIVLGMGGSSLCAEVFGTDFSTAPGYPELYVLDSTDPERVLSFQGIIRRGVPCFIRKPRGRDIYAACGQLKRNS